MSTVGDSVIKRSLYTFENPNIGMSYDKTLYDASISLWRLGYLKQYVLFTIALHFTHASIANT